jgi:ABC-type sugar transport system substrate-binding protein
MVSQYMIAAANLLGMQIEVIYAERDHLLMLRQAEELARRSEPPDYIMIVNEKLAAQQMLMMLASSHAKVFLFHNDLTPEQRRQIGNERERISNWIGTATIDSSRGAYNLMEYLYRRLGVREPRIIGITGDPHTPVSMERVDGVNDYVARAGRGRINQLAFGDWSYADGEAKAEILLSRYPDTNIVWGANDSMALGALRAATARGASVLVGGIGGWPDAIASIAQGGLTASSVAEYLIGAWAIVLLHDYHLGHDFVDHGGANQKLDYMYVVGPEHAARYQAIVLNQAEALDYGVYSKALSPRPGPYDFKLKRLLDIPSAP